MPIKIDDQSSSVPKGPHLAVKAMRSGHVMMGQVIPLEVGSPLMLVEDPSRPDKIFPFFLKKVSRDCLVFELEDTEYRYVLQSAKPLSQKAYARMVENRGGYSGVRKQ